MLGALVGISYPPATTSSLVEQTARVDESSFEVDTSFFESKDVDILLTEEEATSKEPENIKDYAKRKVTEKWDVSHYPALAWIIDHESGWSHTAQNPHSSAYGLAQFINATWGLVGCKKTDDPYVQVDCMIKYVDYMYDNPKAAQAFWKKNKWY